MSEKELIRRLKELANEPNNIIKPVLMAKGITTCSGIKETEEELR